MSKTISSSLAAQVKQAASVLRYGGIVAYPTDTVYGLGADIYNDDAVKKLFTVKNRPMGLPLPVLIADITQLDALVSGQNAFSRALMCRFWPGRLTIIFRKSPGLKSLILSGGNTIGVRIPDHPTALMMIREFGGPVAGTSANLHTGKLTMTPDEVRDQLGNSVDFIVEADPIPGGRESTIVDVTSTPPRIIRHGAVSEDDIWSEYRKRGNK